MQRKTLALIYLILITLFFASCVKMDQSMKVFFPKELSYLHKIQTDFPIFWWNFVLVENKSADMKMANAICKDLKTHIKKEFNMVICGGGDQIPYELMGDWAQDTFARSSYDSAKLNQYIESMNSSMTLALFSPQKSFLQFLRQDPFQSWRDFEKKMSVQTLPSISMIDGYYHVKGTSLIAIPVQFSQKASLVFVKPIIDLLDKYNGDAFLMGSHGSAYRNEFQVKSDLQFVSVITAIVFIIFLIFLVIRAGYSVLLLSVPVGFAVYLAAQVIVWSYGSVHGLTLSFGSGIIGLALDYGLHGLLGKSSQRTWISNFVGMITTLCGILILVFSGIPLIRQMMFFSTIGLVLAFLFYYILFKYFNQYFTIKKIKFSLPYFKYSQILILLITVFGLFGFKDIHMDLDLKKMNLMSDREIEYSKNLFYQPHRINETYMLISDLSKDDFFKKEYFIKSEAQKISYQGIDSFVPNVPNQISNLQSWKNQGCRSIETRMNSVQKKFYEPFFKDQCRKDLIKPIQVADREYLKQFISGDDTLSLFYPETESQVLYLEKNIPEAVSIVKSIATFSDVLEKELEMMIPISLLLTLLILYLYYRQWVLVLCAVFPFCVGISLFFISASVFHIEIDLIAVLGLVMVFGFSIDYGVFSTDTYFYNFDNQEKDNVYTALSLASTTNLLGFLPMIFAVHPVLKQFGYPLFFGTLGAYLGAIYGLKYYFNSKVQKTERSLS
jgi:predicted RND superfamily exporter protein